MSVELPDEKYKQLVKDADENRAIINVFKWAFFILLFIVFMFTYGCHAIDMHKQKDIARTQVEVRDIQQGNMDFDDYIKWLEANNECA